MLLLRKLWGDGLKEAFLRKVKQDKLGLHERDLFIVDLVA